MTYDPSIPLVVPGQTTRILSQSRHLNASAFEGCTDEEIRLIQGHIGKVLPSDYVQFLKEVGRCSAGAFDHCGVHWPEILETHRLAGELIKPSEEASLMVPVWGRDDYEIICIRVCDGFDTGVYMYGEVSGFMFMNESFSEFIAKLPIPFYPGQESKYW